MEKCYITDLFKEMEEYARINNIPIMQSSAINYICDLIKDRGIKNILEIGTAIGYSTIKMCDKCDFVISIERDENRYNEAVKNVKIANMDKKIKLILSDAFDTNIFEKFDMILIDAAKGKNKEFVQKFKNNLKDGGIIIIDNIDFHGFVNHSSDIKSKNLRSLVRKIENFLVYLENQKEFKVNKVDVGDGLIILSKINIGSENDE